MIITRTPFRISFFGGGTDYPNWYRENEGVVLSTTINKYCYISTRYLPPYFDYKYRLRYYNVEYVQRVSEIKHPVVRECLKFLGIDRGIEMVHTSDIPAKSGVGSSSAFTVGFLNSLYALSGKMVTKRQLARESIYMEQGVLEENIGALDQVATAFGGLNRISFGGTSEFYVQPITICKEKLELLQDHLMLFFTGISRNSSDIAAEQIKEIPNKRKELKAMMGMVDDSINILNGDINGIEDFGKLLHEAWEIKRKITSRITTSTIDDIYKTARNEGALGGKILGAGGGGFMLLFVPPEKKERIRKKLNKLVYVPFQFESLGTQTIHYAQQDF
jgi:D-glycero-alpha-D-manno-heptose-7-phosphate kinase